MKKKWNSVYSSRTHPSTVWSRCEYLKKHSTHKGTLHSKHMKTVVCRSLRDRLQTWHFRCVPWTMKCLFKSTQCGCCAAVFCGFGFGLLEIRAVWLANWHPMIQAMVFEQALLPVNSLKIIVEFTVATSTIQSNNECHQRTALQPGTSF